MIEAIIYQGPAQNPSGTSDSDLLKNSKLMPLDLSTVSPFRQTFNGVYSNEIVKEPAEAATETSAPENQTPAVTAFLAYMMKSPEELYFERILKEKGLTPEQFEMLPQKEKAALREEIMEEVKLRMEEDVAKKAAGKQV